MPPKNAPPPRTSGLVNSTETASASKAGQPQQQKQPPRKAAPSPKKHEPSPQGKATSPGKHPAAVLVPVRKKKRLHPIEVLLGETLVNAAGDTISPKRLVVEGGIVGLYFAAKWCPPCRILFPQLMLLYEEVKKSNPNFEMIYVSFDFSEESFKEYFAKMPWLAVKYEDEERREDLGVTFNVRGIPLFVILDVATLEVINREARFLVEVDPRGEHFPWRDMPRPSFIQSYSVSGNDEKGTSEAGQEQDDAPPKETVPAEDVQGKSTTEIERNSNEAVGSNSQTDQDQNKTDQDQTNTSI